VRNVWWPLPSVAVSYSQEYALYVLQSLLFVVLTPLRTRCNLQAKRGADSRGAAKASQKLSLRGPGNYRSMKVDTIKQK